MRVCRQEPLEGNLKGDESVQSIMVSLNCREELVTTVVVTRGEKGFGMFARRQADERCRHDNAEFQREFLFEPAEPFQKSVDRLLRQRFRNKPPCRSLVAERRIRHESAVEFSLLEDAETSP